MPTTTTTTVGQTASNALPSKNDIWMEKIPELLEFFPKRLQNRARIIFMSLHNHMKIDEDNRIIYTMEDGAIMQGSSIIALVHYVITPLPPNKKQNRPFDLTTFAKVLQKAGVPNNVYGNGKQAVINNLLSSAITTTNDNNRSELHANSNSTSNMSIWRHLY